jgi:signal transduction histidine kinase
MTLEPAAPDAGPRNDVDIRPPGTPAVRCRAPGDHDSRVHHTAEQQWLGRRALERQLHDGAALRISALALRLGLLRHQMSEEKQEFHDTVEGLQDELHLVLQELRDVAGRLYPPLLDEAGLGCALREVAGRSAVPVRIDAPDERFGPAAEGAAYFALLGCLTTGPSHESGEGGRPIDVVVRRDADTLVLLVTGVDSCHAASIHDGVRLLGGTVVAGEAGQISVRIPCE